MEYEKIKKLMDDMGNSNLSEINIDFPDGTKIQMKKNLVKEEVITKVISKSEEESGAEKQEIKNDSKPQEEVPSGNIVKSPMVGTFYLKPSPTSEPYVQIGKDVKKGDTLCIIEAMKLMNEIESEFTGKVKNIFVKDGETVEYGTKLFEIE